MQVSEKYVMVFTCEENYQYSQQVINVNLQTKELPVLLNLTHQRLILVVVLLSETTLLVLVYNFTFSCRHVEANGVAVVLTCFCVIV